MPLLSIERIHDVRNQAYFEWRRGVPNRLWKNVFCLSRPSDFSIEIIFNARENRMCFERESRIAHTEANFVTCVDRQCAFHGYCPMDEQIVPQRARHRAAPLSYDECGEGVHDEVPARGEFPVSGSQGCSPKGRRRNGRARRIRYPRRFYGGYHGVRGVYLSASGEGDVEGQAPGVIYSK